MGFSLFGKNKQSASDTGADELEGKVAPRRRRKSADEPVDPVLPEKKRARRRLVGAAAMVLAAIIGLPMLMESEPQPLSDDVRIVIPSIEKPVSDVVSANPDHSPVENHSAGRIATPDPIQTKASSSAEDSAQAAKQTVAEQSKTETVKPEPSKPAETASSSERERIAQVKALLEGKTEHDKTAAKASAETESSQFVLQVAALGSLENAKELQARLSKSGIRSYTEKIRVADGEQIRVRVGPFGSREEADKMRSKLSGMGLDGMVMPI